MEHVVTILEREGEALEVLLFKLVETKLILAADEARFLPRATREVERARARAREIDLMRATTMARFDSPMTLREIAADASGAWPSILRDHHAVLSGLVEEIGVTAHLNSTVAEQRMSQLRSERAHAETVALASRETGASGSDKTAVTIERPNTRLIRNGELDWLARGAALETVFGTAARLRMPDLVEFLR